MTLPLISVNEISSTQVGKSVKVIGRVAAWDTTTNGIIIKDHKNSSGQLRLPPLGSSTDVVRGQVYLFYGVISSYNGDCQDPCLEVTCFSAVTEIDLKAYETSLEFRRVAIQEGDDIARSVINDILGGLDTDPGSATDIKAGMQRFIVKGITLYEQRQCLHRTAPDAGEVICAGSPDDHNVKHSVPYAALYATIAKSVLGIYVPSLRVTRGQET